MPVAIPSRDVIKATTVLLDEEYKKFESDKHFLSARQRIIGEYVKNMSRGILCYWETGRGKTRLAVGIIESIRQIDPHRTVRFMCPKSLVDNMRDTAIKYMKYVNHMTQEKAEEYVDREYNFISSNASNMYDQVIRVVSRGTLDDVDIANDFKHYASLENSVLLIDEAQLFFNSITNGSQNAVKLYDIIMRTKNIKLVFFSGTPITNDPFECVPCFNMLSGNGSLFPEDPEQFEEWYVDRERSKIKNIQSLQRRMYGMITYFGSEDINKREGFPEQLPLQVVRVNMSVRQFTEHSIAREAELKESTRKAKVKGRFGASKGGSSTYRVHSRQICNYIDSEVTPKFKQIYRNIMINVSTDRRLGYVYSNFVEKGLVKFAELLASHGWTEWKADVVMGGAKKPAKSEVPKPEKDIPLPKGGLRYAFYTGSVPIEERKLLVDTFNSPENIRGGVIDLILISSGAGSVGLSFRGVRHEHIMEPYWNMITIEQALARGIRNGSHDHLEPDERNVQPYLYLSVIDPSMVKERKKEQAVVELQSTDEDLYDKAVAAKKLIEQYLRAMAEASIDCKLNNIGLNCLQCAPSDASLYYADIAVDIENNCGSVSSESVAVKEVVVDGTSYYYRYNGAETLENLQIFQYVKKLDAYVPIKGNPALLEAILKGRKK